VRNKTPELAFIELRQYAVSLRSSVRRFYQRKCAKGSVVVAIKAVAAQARAERVSQSCAQASRRTTARGPLHEQELTIMGWGGSAGNGLAKPRFDCAPSPSTRLQWKLAPAPRATRVWSLEAKPRYCAIALSIDGYGHRRRTEGLFWAGVPGQRAGVRSCKFATPGLES